MGTANPPHTTSPNTSYTITSLSSSNTFKSSSSSIVVIIPLPAQPIPASGPPVSTHSIPLKPL